MTAEEVIREAREIHPAFTPEQHPNATLLRALARIQDRLRGELKRLNPEALAREFRVTLPLSATDFADGVALPAHEMLMTGEVRGPGDYRTVLFLVPHASRLAPALFPSATVFGRRLFLTATPEVWRDFTELRLPYVPVAPPLHRPDSEFALPDSARNALVDRLALFMAGRTIAPDGLPPLDRAFLAAEAEASEAHFLSREGIKQATIGFTREVW